MDSEPRYEVRVEKSALGAKRSPFESFFEARRTARSIAAQGQVAVIYQLMSGPYRLRRGGRPIWRFSPAGEERL